jgi:hypothetical protein
MFLYSHEKCSSAHCCRSLSGCRVPAGTRIALQPLYTYSKLYNVPVESRGVHLCILKISTPPKEKATWVLNSSFGNVPHYCAYLMTSPKTCGKHHAKFVSNTVLRLKRQFQWRWNIRRLCLTSIQVQSVFIDLTVLNRIRSIFYYYYYLFKLQMRFLPGDSGTTIRRSTQNNTPHSNRNTAHKTTQTIKDTLHTMITMQIQL